MFFVDVPFSVYLYKKTDFLKLKIKVSISFRFQYLRFHVFNVFIQ